MTTLAACKLSLPGLAWQTMADGSCVGMRMGYDEHHRIKVWKASGAYWQWQCEWYRLSMGAAPNVTETLCNRRRDRLLWAVSQRIEREAQALASLAGGSVCH